MKKAKLRGYHYNTCGQDPRYRIDFDRKVYVYKNLHKDCWSVKQDGLVKMHTTELLMHNCSFRVSAKGRERVIKEKRKNVHAGVSGWIEAFGPTDWDDSHPHAKSVTYNPYKYESFVYRDDEEACFWSSSVKLSGNSVDAVPCIPSANFVSKNG